MRFHYIIKNEGRRSAFSDTIALSQEARDPARRGAQCVNNGLSVPDPLGWGGAGGAAQSCGPHCRVWEENPPAPPNEARAVPSGPA